MRVALLATLGFVVNGLPTTDTYDIRMRTLVLCDQGTYDDETLQLPRLALVSELPIIFPKPWIV